MNWKKCTLIDLRLQIDMMKGLLRFIMIIYQSIVICYSEKSVDAQCMTIPKFILTKIDLLKDQ